MHGIETFVKTEMTMYSQTVRKFCWNPFCVKRLKELVGICSSSVAEMCVSELKQQYDGRLQELQVPLTHDAGL